MTLKKGLRGDLLVEIAQGKAGGKPEGEILRHMLPHCSRTKSTKMQERFGNADALAKRKTKVSESKIQV
jgi:hypothetical protein